MTDPTTDGSLVDLFDLPPGPGHHPIFAPGEHGIEWLGLDLVRLEAGEEWKHRFDDRESLLVVVAGSCGIRASDRSYELVGGRADVFAGPPHAIYAPPGADLIVAADGALEIAVVSARSDDGTEIAHISPDDVKLVSVGRANWRRDIRLIVPPGSPIGKHLIVGETVNPPGNWSGIAPHRHDRVTDDENAMEELYLFKASPRDGFGLQVCYRDRQGGGHLIGHDRVAFIHGGFHATVAAPGTRLCYLWALAGERKDSRLLPDPRFAWLPSTEAILAESERS